MYMAQKMNHSFSTLWTQIMHTAMFSSFQILMTKRINVNIYISVLLFVFKIHCNVITYIENKHCVYHYWQLACREKSFIMVALWFLLLSSFFLFLA